MGMGVLRGTHLFNLRRKHRKVVFIDVWKNIKTRGNVGNVAYFGKVDQNLLGLVTPHRMAFYESKFYITY